MIEISVLHVAWLWPAVCRVLVVPQGSDQRQGPLVDRAGDDDDERATINAGPRPLCRLVAAQRREVSVPDRPDSRTSRFMVASLTVEDDLGAMVLARPPSGLAESVSEDHG